MRQRKRLCIIFWDMGLGGIQKRIRDIVIDLSNNYADWEIYILLRKRSQDGFDYQIKKIDRVYVKYYDANSRFRIPLGFVFWLGWQYLKIQPDTVLTFHCLLSSVLVIYRYIIFWRPTKLVLNEGAITSQALRWDKLSSIDFLIRFMYPLANIVIVPTLACKNDLVQNYSLSEKKISVVPNWTMFPLVKSLSFRYDIVYVGRFSPEKNPLFMVQLTKMLIPQYPRLKVVMIGHGSMQFALKDNLLKEQLQNYMHIIPFSGKISTFIRRSRLLVVPSFNEGMPNVVLEAAMCGVPSVVSHFAGADEVVQHGKTGYVCETFDNMVYCIDTLLSNESLRKIMGQNAQRYVSKNFTYKAQQCFIKTLLS